MPKLNKPLTYIKDLRCRCGGQYRVLPDEDSDETPPSMLAKLFSCYKCRDVSWCEPTDFTIDDWDEVVEFQQERLSKVADNDENPYVYS